jgi:hypothetical protein
MDTMKKIFIKALTLGWISTLAIVLANILAPDLDAGPGERFGFNIVIFFPLLVVSFISGVFGIINYSKYIKEAKKDGIKNYFIQIIAVGIMFIPLVYQILRVLWVMGIITYAMYVNL